MIVPLFKRTSEQVPQLENRFCQLAIQCQFRRWPHAGETARAEGISIGYTMRSTEFRKGVRYHDRLAQVYHGLTAV